jgi:hypothetical protein
MNSMSVAVSCAQPTANATPKLKLKSARMRLAKRRDVLTLICARLYPWDRGIAFILMHNKRNHLLVTSVSQSIWHAALRLWHFRLRSKVHPAL